MTHSTVNFIHTLSPWVYTMHQAPLSQKVKEEMILSSQPIWLKGEAGGGQGPDFNSLHPARNPECSWAFN